MTEILQTNLKNTVLVNRFPLSNFCNPDEMSVFFKKCNVDVVPQLDLGCRTFDNIQLIFIDIGVRATLKLGFLIDRFVHFPKDFLNERKIS